MRDLGLLKFDDPVIKLFNQGMLHGSDRYGMSKSRGNVVLPEEVSKEYGIDTVRLFLVSMASPDKDVEWNEKGIEGTYKFIKKVLAYFDKLKFGKVDSKTESKLNKTIKEVTEDIENFRYNLVVIKLRNLFDFFPEKTSKEVLGKFLKLLSVFCPHIAEELWSKLGNKNLISLSDWPKADKSKINESYDKEDGMISKVVRDLVKILSIVGKKSKAYIYVLPNEKDIYVDNLKDIEKRTNLKVEIVAVNEKKKYDPENKSKKVKPGRPGIYLE